MAVDFRKKIVLTVKYSADTTENIFYHSHFKPHCFTSIS